jgi:predicted enzyme related to lactoylglutathione lyase
MSYVNANQPDGTPTWIDLGVPDHERAMAFYGAVFGWDFKVGPPGAGGYVMCLLHGRAVAAIRQVPDSEVSPVSPFGWTMYFATGDCDRTAQRITAAGGSLIEAPTDLTDQARVAMAQDPLGARFGLWQGRAHIGCQVVNEPGSLVRNDLVTPAPEPARAFYPAVFDHTMDLNEDLPGVDFTFLRRPDGHEIGGIFGLATAPTSTWTTLFEVADTDAVAKWATAAGGTSSASEDSPYGRMATITDPFGAEFSVGTRP